MKDVRLYTKLDATGKKPLWTAHFTDHPGGIVVLGGVGRGDTYQAAIDDLRENYPNTWAHWSPYLPMEGAA